MSHALLKTGYAKASPVVIRRSMPVVIHFVEAHA
jgi:hypothetical protein